MSFRSIATAISLLGAAAYVSAFAEGPGGACDTVGAACTWEAENSSGAPTTFSGFCAPDLICGDNGASCTTDDNCYDFCGTTSGLCGGEGAVCTSTAPFSTGQEEITCFTPGFTCTSDDPTVGGTCVPATSGGSTKTRHRRMQQRNMKRALNQCDGPTEALCGLSGSLDGSDAFECVDVHSNLEKCGGCVTDGVGQDCTLIAGALDVECMVGACVVSSCAPGFSLVDGVCSEL